MTWPTSKPSRATWRDTTLFLAGLGIIAHETLLHTGPERFGLLMVATGLLGLPVFLRADERRNGTPIDRSEPGS